MQKLFTALMLAAAATIAVTATAKKNGDPVVMQIGSQKVTMSEFKYFHDKNAEQQASTPKLDDYIDMFVNYKLKVEAARRAGIDTTAAYREELKKNIAHLSEPYLRDKEVDDSLVNVAIGHLREVLDVDHILIPESWHGLSRAKTYLMADSLRNALAAGTASWSDVSSAYSADELSASRGGYLGQLTGGIYPYAFEDIAYNTPAGSISEVGKSRFGYHIVRVRSRRPSPGKIKVRHLVKVTRDMSDKEAAIRKKAVDSLYNLAAHGVPFVQLASENTDEARGKATGGELPWFAPGEMVPEFNDAAFALQPGEISQPVKTVFGWHIIYCEERRPFEITDSLRAAIFDRIKGDERGDLAVERTASRWLASHAGCLMPEGADEAARIFSGGGNASSLDALKKSTVPALTVGGRTVTVGQVASLIDMPSEISSELASGLYNSAARRMLRTAALEQYAEHLPEIDPDYRNIYNEYRDGLLFFEISNAKVWQRANADSLGLQRYFETNRADFAWDRPHYKGFVISALNDSIADAVYSYLAETYRAGEPASVSRQEIRKRFGTDAKVDRVLAGRGDNRVVDNLCFGGDKPDVDNRYKAYRLFAGRIIDEPENARDVRGRVSESYQVRLEKEWLTQLRASIKVKVDRKAIHRAFR